VFALATEGDAVTIPLGTTANIKTDASLGNDLTIYSGSGSTYYEMGTSSTELDYTNTAGLEGDRLYVDLTNAAASTINDLREAFQVQKLLERDARAGTRYSELVSNHFGVDFYDVSYRPEYLGGGTQALNVSPVASQAETTTAGTSDGTGVGSLSGIGVSSGSEHGFNKTFVEHGIVMGIISARADLTYQQGLRREFSKSTRYDIYWPSLAHLGEQAVLNKEIYCDGTSNDEDVFGYVPRYDEYRHKLSQISAIFQSGATSSLDSWHLSQEFASLPTLGETFIQEDAPLDRCIQVPSEPHFIVDTYNRLICARPLPVYGTPGMVDHF
jgi:hypothetical protein